MARGAQSQTKTGKKPRRVLRWILRTALVLFLAPLLAMIFFGLILPHTKADIIVVPGAALWDHGTRLSDALRYRMNTAVQLYRDGYATKLLLSGGGEGEWSEALGMARYAREQGVPESAIIIDEHGTSTRATAENTACVLREQGLTHALFVTNWYHVCRSRLALAQAGVSSDGVACEHPYFLRKEAVYVLREMAGLYLYLFCAEDVV